MLGRDFANTTSAIGARTLQQAAIPNNQPNWGVMLAQGLQAWNEKKVQEERDAQLGAYSEALKAQHPEDAARIDAMGALEAGAYYDDLAQKEQDQQNALALLAQKHQYALGEESARNNHAIARMHAENNLRQGIAQAERERQAAAIEEALQNGYITPEQANMARAKMILGDIASGVNETLPEGVALTGNKEYDKVMAKEAAQKAIKYQNARDELNAFNDSANRVLELLPQANLDSWKQRKTPTFWLDDTAQMARAEIRNIMGDLRLDQMQYMKGAISDKEQQFLSDVVSGDISRYTPLEISGALNSIKRKMNAEVTKYAPPIRNVVGNIKTYGQKINQSGKDWSKVSNEDILKGL